MLKNMLKGKERRSAYEKWRSMNRRCYSVNDISYQYYGGIGVTVCEDWKSFEGYLDTIHLVEGFELNSYLSGDIQLDKDKKVKGCTIYSIDTCTFISKKDNLSYQPKAQIPFKAISPQNVVSEVYNQSEFARENNLSQSNISSCLKGKKHHTKGWRFKY